MSMTVQRGVRPIRHDATIYNQSYTVVPTHEMRTVDYTYSVELGGDDTALAGTPHGAQPAGGNIVCAATNDGIDYVGNPAFNIFVGTINGQYGYWNVGYDSIQVVNRDANGYITRVESQNSLSGNAVLNVPSRALEIVGDAYLDTSSLPSSPQTTFVELLNGSDRYAYRTDNAQYFYLDFRCEYQLPDSSWGTRIVSQRQDCRYSTLGKYAIFSALPKKYILTQTETEV